MFPSASAVEAYGQGCYALQHSRPAASVLQLSCTPPGNGPTFCLFGFAAAQSTLPDIVLPPGFAIYLQAVTLLGSKDVRSTHGVVMRGV